MNYQRTSRALAACFTAAGLVIALPASAAEPQSSRQATPTAPAERPSPVLPARKPPAANEAVLPTGGAAVTGQVQGAAPRPDYALKLESQEELPNTAILWHFRVTNVSLVGQTYGAASLVVKARPPCPATLVTNSPLPKLQPGASVKLSAQMPDHLAGKGCQFRAEILYAGDADPGNNVLQLQSKTAQLPDLYLELGVGSQYSDGTLSVRNGGKAPSPPSVVHYTCYTTDLNKSCRNYYEPRQPDITLNVSVPALPPGQAFPVTNFTPNNLPWKAYADHTKQVVESDEKNNNKFGKP